VSGNENISGNLDVSGNENIGGNLDVSGNVNICGNLDVSGNENINGNLDVSGNVNISGNLDVSGNENINGNLDVSGNGNIGGNLDVSGNGNIGGNLDVSGNVNIGGNLDVSGNENISGNLDVSGNVQIGSSNLTSIVGKLEIYENIGTGPYIQDSSGATPHIAGPVVTGGSLVINHNNSGDSPGFSSIIFPSTINYPNDYGYIQYFDNVNNGGIYTLTNESGLLLIGIETDSTTNYGPDRISLFPCQGNGFVGINTMYPKYSLDVSGNVNISNNLYVSGNSLLRNGVSINYSQGHTQNTNYALDVNGNERVTGNVDISGNLDISGNGYFSNGVTIDGNLIVNGSYSQNNIITDNIQSINTEDTVNLYTNNTGTINIGSTNGTFNFKNSVNFNNGITSTTSNYPLASSFNNPSAGYIGYTFSQKTQLSSYSYIGFTTINTINLSGGIWICNFICSFPNATTNKASNYFRLGITSSQQSWNTPDTNYIAAFNSYYLQNYAENSSLGSSTDPTNIQFNYIYNSSIWSGYNCYIQLFSLTSYTSNDLTCYQSFTRIA
jgi:predicted acyltransferase (DUF342 family)